MSMPLPTLDIFANMGEKPPDSQTTCEFKCLFTYSWNMCISSANFLDMTPAHFHNE